MTKWNLFFDYCSVKKLSIERFVFTIFINGQLWLLYISLICYRVNVLSYYVTGSINTEVHILSLSNYSYLTIGS